MAAKPTMSHSNVVFHAIRLADSSLLPISRRSDSIASRFKVSGLTRDSKARRRRHQSQKCKNRFIPFYCKSRQHTAGKPTRNRCLSPRCFSLLQRVFADKVSKMVTAANETIPETGIRSESQSRKSCTKLLKTYLCTMLTTETTINP